MFLLKILFINAFWLRPESTNSSEYPLSSKEGGHGSPSRFIPRDPAQSRHYGHSSNQTDPLPKPETHDFGKVTATKDSTPLIVTVTNKSSSAVTFTSIVAADTFSIQSDKSSGAPLPPSKSCKVEVVFHPMVTGKVNAPNGLTFTDSAQNGPQQVELEGRGSLGSFL